MEKYLFKLWLYIFCIGLVPTIYADQFIDSYQASCDSKTGYFSFKTITHSEVNPSVSSSLPPLTSLKSSPYVCELDSNVVISQPRKISLEIMNHIPAHESGECATRDQFTLSLKIDGIEKKRFSAFGDNRCLQQESQIVEITPFLTRICVIPESAKSTSFSCSFLK